MTTNTLTPAALAEIRERDATCTRCGMPGDGAYPIIPVTGEHADWHICALALYHASIAKDATISRLTAELAAARKPQGLTELVTWVDAKVRVPEDREIRNVICEDGSGALAYHVRDLDSWLFAVSRVAVYVVTHWCDLRGPTLGAQDGGEGQS